MLRKKSVNNLPAYILASHDLKSNSGQWEVYESLGNCVVLAGPGSGKTKTLTIKMARIINEDVEEPRGVACITYNSECARELKRRLNKLGISERKNIFIGTVHSFCLKNILIPFGKMAGLSWLEHIEIVPIDLQNELFELTFNMTIGKREQFNSRWVTSLSKYRRIYLDRSSKEWETINSDLAVWIENYENELRKRGFIDFDDMVLLGNKLIEENQWIREIIKAKFPIIIVDEYQDLGLALHNIVLNLCFKAGIRILVVGDPDQSIYGFTGANPKLLRQLSKMEGVKSINLKLNYRCGSKIVRASQVTLGEDRGYQAHSTSGEGTIDFYEYREGLTEQVEGICRDIIPSLLTRNPGSNLGDIAILYLNKNDGDLIAQAAITYHLDYIRIDQNAPYAKTALTRWLEECALWCSGGWKSGEPRLSELIRGFLSFIRGLSYDSPLYLTMKRNLIKFLWNNRTQDERLYNWLSSYESECLYLLLDKNGIDDDERRVFRKLLKACSSDGTIKDMTVKSFAGQGGSPNHLNLITLHSSKGLEYKFVIMLGMDQGKIPINTNTPSLKSEPRRLFYVGLTRAKKEVHMTYSGWYLDQYNRVYTLGPSEFLEELKRRSFTL